MPGTSFNTSDVQARKAWSERVHEDVTNDKELLGSLVKDGTIILKEDLTKDAGDLVNFHLRRRLSNVGFADDEAATGNEQRLNYDQAQVKIRELRNATLIAVKGTINAQRVTFDMDEDSYQVLKNWMIERKTVSAFNQLAGNTATTITYDGATYTGGDLTKITGMESAIAPSTNNIIRAGTSNTTDQAVNADTTATFKLSLIDQAEQAAAINRPYILPLSTRPGDVMYKCYIHPKQWTQLIQDTTAPIQFRDIYLSQITAGNSSSIKRSIIYSQTEIIPTDKVPYGVHSSSGAEQTNVRRAVFVGKEAAAMAFGKGYSDGKTATAGFSFQMDTQDIEKWRQYAITSVYGIRKTQYNSVDRGSIVISTYVA